MTLTKLDVGLWQLYRRQQLINGDLVRMLELGNRQT